MRALPWVLAGLCFAAAKAAAPEASAWGPVTPGPVAPAASSGSGEAAAARRADRVMEAFREGERRRVRRDVEGALAAFERAAALGRGTSLGARARYEAGHVLRREGRWAEALAAYERVHRDPAATVVRRDLAGQWLARSRLEMGQADEGERLLRRLVEDALDPVTRVRVHDLLVSLLVERGELAAAVGWLARCKRSVHDVSVEETRRGARVRAALEDMRGLVELREAIAARMRRAASERARRRARRTRAAGRARADETRVTSRRAPTRARSLTRCDARRNSAGEFTM